MRIAFTQVHLTQQHLHSLNRWFIASNIAPRPVLGYNSTFI